MDFSIARLVPLHDGDDKLARHLMFKQSIYSDRETGWMRITKESDCTMRHLRFEFYRKLMMPCSRLMLENLPLYSYPWWRRFVWRSFSSSAWIIVNACSAIEWHNFLFSNCISWMVSPILIISLTTLPSQMFPKQFRIIWMWKLLQDGFLFNVFCWIWIQNDSFIPSFERTFRLFDANDENGSCWRYWLKHFEMKSRCSFERDVLQLNQMFFPKQNLKKKLFDWNVWYSNKIIQFQKLFNFICHLIVCINLTKKTEILCGAHKIHSKSAGVLQRWLMTVCFEGKRLRRNRTEIAHRFLYI